LANPITNGKELDIWNIAVKLAAKIEKYGGG
jgi:hypothetical protein